MIRVRTLGQCAIHIDSARVGPDAEIVFASLLLLTVERGRRVSRGELLSLLWPAASASRAAHCLRQTIYRLRTLGAPIEVDRTHVGMPADAVDSDVDALLRASRVDDVEHLAERVRGPFVPGYVPAFSEPLRDWVERKRDLVTASARRVLAGAINARKLRGEWADVERLAHRCLAIDPLNEEATLALAEAAALHGGKVEAIGILDRYLREMGPTARELRLPAMTLRRRIAEPQPEFPLAQPLHIPFVGRSAEMATLTAALRNARGGCGSVHFIHGEPGIGKTRLLTEFTRAATLEGARVAPALCQSSDSRRPLSAFVDLVPRLMTMPGALGCSPQSHKYLRRLIEHHSSEAPPTPDTSEATLLYANVRRSLFDLFDAIALESPLLLSVEDVHWLDDASWEFLAEAIPWIRTRRMIVVLTSRDGDPRSSLTTTPPPEPPVPLSLGPLDCASRQTLLAATVRESGQEISTAFSDWCIERSGGNPYYLSELALHGQGAHGEFAVPPSLTTLVAERVARLRPVSRRVLQACAILGKNATLDRVEAILERRREDLLDALDELEQRGLIEWDETHIVSRHDLLSEAAIARLSALARRLLHQHAALALERTLLDELSPGVAWACAEHWSRAGALERGVRLLQRCARQSIEMGRPREASQLLLQARTLPLPSASRVRVTTELIYAYRAADCWHDAAAEFERLRVLNRTETTEQAIHDDVELVGLEAQWFGGAHPTVVIAQILECCRSPAATAAHRLGAARLGLIIASNLGDVKTGCLIRDLVSRDLTDNELDLADRVACRLVFEASFGDRSVACERLEEVVAAAPRVPPRRRAILLVFAAHAYERLGILDRVCDVAAEAYRLSEAVSYGTGACAAARKLAWYYVQQGEYVPATHWYSVAKSWVERGQFSSFWGDVLGLEAELLIAEGKLAAAEEALRRSVEAWGNTVHPRWRLYVLASHCAIWLATGEFGKCESVIGDFRELFSAVGLEGGNDIIAARFVRILQHAGRSEEAEETLSRYLSARNQTPHPYGGELAAVLDAQPFGVAV